jgi:hypothetical protein
MKMTLAEQDLRNAAGRARAICRAQSACDRLTHGDRIAHHIMCGGMVIVETWRGPSLQRSETVTIHDAEAMV